MVLKKKLFSTRTNLTILLVILIILIGYVVYINLPPSIDYLNPHEVTSNFDSYTNKNIIIKGYLDKNDANESIITNTMDTTKTRYEILVDYSNISNIDNLREGSIYYFTGVLNKITDIDGIPFPIPIYVFYAEKFELV